jgi:hypothetical protein
MGFSIWHDLSLQFEQPHPSISRCGVIFVCFLTKIRAGKIADSNHCTFPSITFGYETETSNNFLFNLLQVAHR